MRFLSLQVNLPVYDYDKMYGEVFFKYMGNHYFSYFFDDRTFDQFFKGGE